MKGWGGVVIPLGILDSTNALASLGMASIVCSCRTSAEHYVSIVEMAAFYQSKISFWYRNFDAINAWTVGDLGKWATTREDAIIWPRTALGLCCLDKTDFKRQWLEDLRSENQNMNELLTDGHIKVL